MTEWGKITTTTISKLHVTENYLFYKKILISIKTTMFWFVYSLLAFCLDFMVSYLSSTAEIQSLDLDSIIYG